jgi:hypothetical protein
MFIRELLEALAAAEIRYCIVGGVAVNLLSCPEFTTETRRA